MKPTPVLFVALLFGLPLAQAVVEWRNHDKIGALEVFGSLEESRLRKFEEDLADASLVRTELAPWLQLGLTKTLGRGNEKAIVGWDGALHLAADLDSISAASYLDGAINPVDAIVDFHRQLKLRGVELLLLPTPEKTASSPSTFLFDLSGVQIPHPDTAEFFEQLAQADIEFVDLFEFYKTLTGRLYLKRDTHWTPGTMESVATEVARRATELVEIPKTREWSTEPEQFYSSGDMLGMLNYPRGRSPYLLMQIETQRVLDAESGNPCVPDRSSPVLLLGDSFTRVFSDEQLGLGEHAGLQEHLAKELSTSIDVIALAGGGARAVRESLARRKEGLTGKRIVIWQFSMRDLPMISNHWECIDLGQPRTAPPVEGQIEVTAEVVEVTRVENFEYAFGLAIFEYRIMAAHSGEVDGDSLWIAHIAVQDFNPTEAASYNVGDTHRLVLEPIEKHYDLESTSWADDTDADFEIWFPVRRVE